LPGPDEQKLIAAAHRGDRAAFQEIVERHQGAVYGYLRCRLLEPADAEDLTQEVFLRSYVGHARFEGTVMIRPWLLGIARNLLREHARKIKRRKEVAWTELCLRLEEDLLEFETHTYEDVMVHLPTCLGSLGQSARQALDLRYQARLRLSEIGEKLHRSEGAIKLLMFRARQALKRCLDSKILQEGTPAS
jgi:RNA polymerase sigma-70 factor (ECF subfamily)